MSGAILIQSLKQLWGMIVLEYKYHGNLPNIENYHTQVKYSLPFDGEWVVANGGVTEKTSHSWEIPTQRYAYDFIILDNTGSSFKGDETEAGSFYCYGRDILAPADGSVAEICTGNLDSGITKNRAVSCKARDIRGNYILICHSDQEYTLSAHLKPDSIQVSVGQSVKRGEKIAEIPGTPRSRISIFRCSLGKAFIPLPGCR